MRALVVVVIVVVALASVAASAGEKKPFGPFDAGAVRDVVRQGKKGTPRHAHPAVGDPAKVPGEGPPPPPIHQDRDIPEGALASPNALGGSLSANPLFLASLLYSNIITRIDGPRCSHLPTCSRFASQAVARHGALGILMGLDRVIQPNESSPLRRLPEVNGYGQVRAYDPVENYEFWRADLFTGFPPPTKEQPLALPPLSHAEAARRPAGAPPTTTTSTATTSTATTSTVTTSTVKTSTATTSTATTSTAATSTASSRTPG